MTRVLPTLLLAQLLAAGAARADGYLDSRSHLPTRVSLSWEALVPRHSLRAFVDRASFRGGQLEVGFGVARHLSLGLSASWNWLAGEAATDSLQFPDAVVTGAAYRRVQLTELRATLHWYLASGPVQPWVGAGLGGGWHETYLAVADQARTASGWHAAAEPRAGLLWTVGAGLALGLQARYAFTTARLGEAADVRWLAVDLGLTVY
ncbi:MAG TPA: hypothetical protein VFI16_08265 [Anaeromyxobacteraceae bacterium]|nr:hypothetical protein [Anaeromyxobacteraceae bacterium]